MAASGFPRYTDGDVTVIVSPSKVYQLHSRTLHRVSQKFARMLDEYPAAKLTAAARRDGCTPYQFELRNAPSQLGLGTFVRIGVSENGRLFRENDPFLLTNINNVSRVDDQEKYWDWLFCSFYNIPPRFDDHNLATVLRSCMGLIDVAEAVEAVEQVREHIDLALLRQDQVLWQSVAANPIAWTELGCRVNSPSIFEEGVIHLVGTWQRMTEEEKGELRPEIRDLVQTKWQELDMAKQAIDIRILGHYPLFLCRNHADKPHRTSYSSDIYMWMAIDFFRQWYAQAISECRGRFSADGGFQFYNQVAQGGNAYLHHEDFQAFHQYFPMSSKACNVLESNMNVLKEEVKVFVKDLVKKRTKLKDDRSQVQWLTCAVVNRDECPWVQTSMARTVTEQYHIDRALCLDQDFVRSSPARGLGATTVSSTDQLSNLPV